MTTYERDQAANEWAHRHRFYVWGFWPAVFASVMGWTTFLLMLAGFVVVMTCSILWRAVSRPLRQQGE
jgi:uncharacterized membrane protein